ncbi:ROK family protein [Isoptericola sp. NPDC057559]|uniref:ROK family transcriptional regulator n=1 Tax=Isoptericola sp. NPDC057559 TaxID=3346168 RepID=UPI0036A3D316
MPTSDTGTLDPRRGPDARAVLDVLAAGGPAGEDALVEATGLPAATVGRALAALTEAGAVVADGAPGRVRVDPDSAFGLGVDVARDRVRVALVDATGTVRARAERRDVQRTPVARARAAAGLANSCREDVEARLGPGRRVEVGRAVVAFPAVVGVDHTTVLHVPGYEKGGTTLHDALTDALACPVSLDNDVNLAAVAEQHLGAGRGRSSFVTLAFGEGFGAGVVLDGRLHRGASGIAGEVAFLPQPGHALGEQVLGDAAIAALAKDHDLPEDITVRELIDRADAGDGVADAVVAEMARRVAVVVASLAIVLDPELFVLGDQAARPPIAQRVTAFLRDRISVLPVRIEASPLGADGAVLGAGHAAGEALRAVVAERAVAASDGVTDGASR